jgi:uncharacterized protein (DUF1501 family)
MPGGLARTWAAVRAPEPGERVLVIVQLTGGNDGLNTVVPFRDDRYHRARPVLALRPERVVRLNDHLGLHPALGALLPLWDEGSLAVVQGVGYPEENRSHFRSMEIWHTARTDETPPTAGWLGLSAALAAERAAATAADAPPALPFVRVGGRDLPLALAGAPHQVPALETLKDLVLESPVAEERGASARALLQELCRAPAGRTGQAAFVSSADGAAFDCAQRLHDLARSTSGGGPDTPLGRSLALAAQLVGAQLGTRVVYVTHEGFDTHARQERSHELCLRALGDALADFQDRLRRQGDEHRVTTLVFSEFGRRIEENASAGTDHGAAAPVFVLGRPVKGGVLGADPDLSGERDADVPVSTDFRGIYVSLLDWLGMPAAPVVPGEHPRLPLFA